MGCHYAGCGAISVCGGAFLLWRDERVRRARAPSSRNPESAEHTPAEHERRSLFRKEGLVGGVRAVADCINQEGEGGSIGGDAAGHNPQTPFSPESTRPEIQALMTVGLWDGWVGFWHQWWSPPLAVWIGAEPAHEEQENTQDPHVISRAQPRTPPPEKETKKTRPQGLP